MAPPTLRPEHHATATRLAPRGSGAFVIPRGSVLSGAAARVLGATYASLYHLIRVKLIPPPPRDPSGRLWWRPEDLARARDVLRGRNYCRRPAAGGCR